MENMAYMLISMAMKIQSLPPSLNKSKHQKSLIDTFIHMFINLITISQIIKFHVNFLR